MAWLSVFVSVLTLLAVCRITRLITEDTITKPFRDWVARKAYPRPPAHGSSVSRPAPRAWRWADKLLACPWCSGFWISLVVVGGYFRCWLGQWPWADLPHAFGYAVAVLACSYASALIADWLDSPPPPKVITLTPSPLDVNLRQNPDDTSL